MLVSSDTLPFDSVVMTKRCFSRVSPATESGHGSSRCHARFRSATSASGTDADARAVEQLVEDQPVQRVDLQPRQLAACAPGPSPPGTRPASVGERRPILGEPMPFAEHLELADDAAAPVDDRAEDVEGQRPGQLVTAPGPPCPESRRRPGSPAPPGRPTTGTAPAAAVAAPPRPACPSPAPISACAPGVRLMNSPKPDAHHADVAQQQPVHLDRRNAAAGREAQHQQPALGRQHADRVVERIAADRVDHDVDAAAVGVLAHGLRPPVGQRQHHVGAERLDELRRRPAGAPSRSPWRPTPLRSGWPPCRRHRPSRAPAPSRRPAAPPRRTSAKYIV